MFDDVNETPISTGNENLDIVVNGMKKLLPIFDNISDILTDKIEDILDDAIDLFY